MSEMDKDENRKSQQNKDDLQLLIQQTIDGNNLQQFNQYNSVAEIKEELGIYYRELEFQNDELRRTQLILENTQNELLDLFENAPVGYAIYNDDYLIDTSNKYFEQLVAKSKVSLKLSNFSNLIAPESQDNFYLHIRKLNSTNGISSCELFLLLNNKKIPVKVETNFKLKHGKKSFMSAITDLRAQKKAENALKVSEMKYRFMTENSTDVIWYLDKNFVLEYISPADERMRGFSQSELIGQMPWFNFKPEDIEKIKNARANRLENEAKGIRIGPVQMELEQVCKDGRWIWTEVSSNVLYDKNFNIIGYHGITRDITKRKAAENELENSRLELKAIYDNAPVMMCLVNNKREILFSNKAFSEFTRTSLTDLVGVKVLGAVIGCVNAKSSPLGCGFGHKCKDCVIRKAIESTFKTGISKQNIEYYAEIESENCETNLSLLGSTALIKGARADNLLLCLTDITDRKKIENALAESEEKYRMIAENTSDGIIFIGSDNKTKYVSPAYIKQVGYSESELINRDKNLIYNIIHPEDRDLLFARIFSAIEHKKNELVYVYRTKHALGHYFWREDHARFKYDENNVYQGAYVICRDITERKIAGEALEKSEKRFKTIFNEAPMGIALTDSLNGNVFSANNKYVEIAGRSMEEMLQLNWMSITHPDDIQPDLDKMALLNTKQIDGFVMEKRYILKDGKHVWINMTIAPIEVENNTSPQHLCMIEDITDRKTAIDALKQSQEDLKQFAAHLQSIREDERTLLAREIHDELGQILIALKIDMGMLKQKVMKETNIDKPVEIASKFDDLSLLVDNTIKTARRIMNGLRPEVLELLGFIESAKIYCTEFNERYNVKCEFESNAKNIVFNPQQLVALFRILQESLSNVARHAMANKVTVNVELKNNLLTLEIKDNGVGFDDSIKIKSDSYGLIGMKERALLLGANISINGNKGTGSHVKLLMPYIIEE